MMAKLSKVAVTGWEARHYDRLLNLLSLGNYSRFIERAIADLQIQSTEQILDLGCGTGKNAERMAKYLGQDGRIVGLDIGDEMLAQAQQRQESDHRLQFYQQRIDKPLPYHGEFDRVFISFVLHGFEQPVREIIIQNAFSALKPGGVFAILDWNEFRLPEQVFWFRIFFTKMECQLASEFITHSWQNILVQNGFAFVASHFYCRQLLRLLQEQKVE